jgi:hypothetical protein
MRNDNVIRVDFKNKQRFGGLKVVSDNTSTKDAEVTPIDVIPVEKETIIETPVNESEMFAVVPVECLDNIMQALIFYAGGKAPAMLPPGYDNRQKAKFALHHIQHCMIPLVQSQPGIS